MVARRILSAPTDPDRDAIAAARRSLKVARLPQETNPSLDANTQALINQSVSEAVSSLELDLNFTSNSW